MNIGYIMNPGPDEDELDAAQDRMTAHGDTTDSQFATALNILHLMSLERSGPWWKRIFSRWWMSDEPLRNDAGRLLRRVGYRGMDPIGYRRVGG